MPLSMLTNILILCVVFAVLLVHSLTDGIGVWRIVSLSLTALAVVLWIAGRVLRFQEKKRRKGMPNQ